MFVQVREEEEEGIFGNCFWVIYIRTYTHVRTYVVNTEIAYHKICVRCIRSFIELLLPKMTGSSYYGLVIPYTVVGRLVELW